MQKTPKYIEIINVLKQQIEDGTIPEGAALPMEKELCRLFSTSHMTLTKAMNELAIKGYVRRIPGKGTFATSGFRTTIRKPLIQSESITERIRNSGLTPRTELVRYAILKGKDIPDVAATLKIDEEDYLHYFLRKRFGNDNLVCLSYTYVSQQIMPTIDITRIQGSFNEYVMSLGIHRSYGYTEFCATLPSQEQALLIGTDHIPLLKQAIMWNVNDEPFELTYHYYVGDKYTITQDLVLKYNEDGSFHKEAVDFYQKSH